MEEIIKNKQTGKTEKQKKQEIFMYDDLEHHIV